MTCTVLVCDDDPDVGCQWAETLGAAAPQAHYSILPPPDRSALHAAIKELFAREAALLAGDWREQEPCVLDGADILVVDHDLPHVDVQNARHTGESLAWFARAFSDAAVVVVVNQFRTRFDLSLQGNPSSDADLNLDVSSLGVPGLWTDPPWHGFRPWHWQTLYQAVETQRARQAWSQEHMNDSVVEALGMRDDDVDRMSDAAFGFLAPDAAGWQDIKELKLKQFAVGSATGRREAKLVESDSHTACRLVAARLGRWLERYVLGAEEMLVDLPHLVQGFPFLLGKEMPALEAWNDVVCSGDRVKSKVPDGCWFEPSELLSRPAVWRQRFEDDDGVREARRNFDYSSVPPFVFLEDTSSFGRLCDAKQFRAGHHNAFDRRFAKCLDGIVYAPQRRFAYWM